MDNFVKSLMDKVINNRNKLKSTTVSEELPPPPPTTNSPPPEIGNNTSEQFMPPAPPTPAPPTPAISDNNNNIVETPTKEEEKEEDKKEEGNNTVIEDTLSSEVPLIPSKVPEPESQETSLSSKENTPVIAEIIHSILNQIQTPSANKPNNDFDQKKDTISQNILISNIIQSILNQISTTTPQVDVEPAPQVDIVPTPQVEAVSDRPPLPTVSNIEGSIIEGLVRPHINTPFRTNQQFTIKSPNKSNTVTPVIEGVIQPLPINTNREPEVTTEKKDNDTDNMVTPVIEGVIQPIPINPNREQEVTTEKKDNDTDNTVTPVVEEGVIRPNNIISVPINTADVPASIQNTTDNYNGNINVNDWLKNTIGNIIIISDGDFMKIENTFKKLQDRASSENV